MKIQALLTSAAINLKRLESFCFCPFGCHPGWTPAVPEVPGSEPSDLWILGDPLDSTEELPPVEMELPEPDGGNPLGGPET